MAQSRNHEGSSDILDRTAAEAAGPAAPLPLGSVVMLDGASHPVMIVGRCLRVSGAEGPALVDYGGCPWPEGLLGDQVVYFDAPAVRTVVSRGYEDEREADFARRIAEATASSDLARRPATARG